MVRTTGELSFPSRELFYSLLRDQNFTRNSKVNGVIVSISYQEGKFKVVVRLMNSLMADYSGSLQEDQQFIDCRRGDAVSAEVASIDFDQVEHVPVGLKNVKIEVRRERERGAKHP